MTELVLDISNKKLVEKFTKFLLGKLNISPKSIEIASTEMKDCHGICVDITEDNYLILVDETDRNITEIFVTIAHEMVHVKQYMKENLGWFLENRSYIPYETRWWEKEAFEKSVEYVKAFAKKVKENAHNLS